MMRRLLAVLVLLCGGGLSPLFAATFTVNPGDTVSTVVAAAADGDTISFNAGTYREQSITPKTNMIINLGPSVTIKGSKILTTFVQSGELWYATGQTQGSATNIGTCSTGYRCGVEEDVFIDGVRQRHMLTLAEVVRDGQYYFDYTADRIYVYGNPTGKFVETSVSGRFLTPTNPGVKVQCQGAIVEHYANQAQTGVIGQTSTGPAADNWEVTHCNVRNNHAIGIAAGNGWVVAHSKMNNNGQMGFGASTNNNGLWYDNEVLYNNEAGFSSGWEAGGGKITHATNVRFFRNRVGYNKGPGIWFDIDNDQALIAENESFWNSNEGIKWEISFAAKILNNKVWDNALGFQDWAFGANIHVQNGEGVLVEGNEVTVPNGWTANFWGPNGIIVSCQLRNPWTCNNNTVRGNVITYRGGRGQTGAMEDIAGEVAGFYTTNLFEGNTYNVVSTASRHWVWQSLSHSWTSWNALWNGGAGERFAVRKKALIAENIDLF